MKPHTRILPSVLAGLVLATSANAAVVLVSENFGGSSGSNLNGTTAATFASAITDAGGSPVWGAHSGFKADGSVTERRKSAHLNLGSYINATKGQANGIFVLQVTLAPVTGASSTAITQLASIGFAVENSPDTFKSFNDQTVGGNTGTTNGLATMGYRINGNLDAWGGPGSLPASLVNGPTGNTGSRTLRITLDLTGWDGTTNFGTATFGADTGAGNTFVDFGNHAYTADQNFGSILISVLGETTAGRTVTADYSNLTLTQIPEPSAALLGGLGLLALLRRRR